MNASLASAGAAAENSMPAAADNTVIQAPVTSWEDAVPLGNGLLGGLFWGEENTLRLSLDRGDLWDERPHGDPDWWRKNPWSSITEQNPDPWGGYYQGATPTKLPSGRLELTLAAGATVESFELRLAEAEGVATLAGGASARAFASATSPVLMLSIQGAAVESLNLVPAGTAPSGGEQFANTHSGGAVAALGYPAPIRGSAGDLHWYVQEAAAGFSYCACVAVERTGTRTRLAVAVATSGDCAPGQDLLALAQERCREALAADPQELEEAHRGWWREFWAQSSVSLPSQLLQRNYQFTRYLYGAGSRKGAPPMPLQGVWTADNGGLPPWKGDYHNDLNTQLTYGAYQQSGDFASGESYLDFLWQLMPEFQQFARGFYGTGGLASPGIMSLSGQPLGGWSQYSMSPTMSAWNAHLFYLHWRYTADQTFLAERAYPWAGGVGECLAELLATNNDGVLVLPRSSSPEVFDNSGEAWLVPNSNYDLMCLKMLFHSLTEMADALGLEKDAARWVGLAGRLGDYHTAPDGELLLDANTRLEESHRHLSNLIGIHPFNLISIEGGADDQQRIRASLAAWDELGTDWWTGYSWSWMGCLRARTGDGDAAARHLEIFARAFTSRNGFHLNGDQTGEGHSKFSYRPFTLEGNFSAMQGIHEMLLQSWSPTPGVSGTEVVRIFPAVPANWDTASFHDLRAQGGHRVSARREGGETTWFELVAGAAGTVRIRDNFGGRDPQWSVPGVVRDAGDFVMEVGQGGVVSATLDQTGEQPPELAARERLQGHAS